MHEPIDTPDAPVPSRENAIVHAGKALSQLSYDERRGANPNKRIDEEKYACRLIQLYMGDWAPHPAAAGEENATRLCPLSIMVGQAMMAAMFIRATTSEDHIVRGDQ